MLTVICKQTGRYLIYRLGVIQWFTHTWWFQDIFLSSMIAAVIPTCWKYLGSGLVNCSDSSGWVWLSVWCSPTRFCPVCHVCLLATNPLLFPRPSSQGQVRATWQSLTVLHKPGRVCCCCCLALARRGAGDTVITASHIMTYKPNSVKDNKDKCCRLDQAMRTLSVLTCGERNFIDRQHRKGKTFVAVVRAAGLWPMGWRHLVTWHWPMMYLHHVPT